MGGVGIKNLYVEQSIEQIKAFTQHTRMESPLGKTMQINLDWVQLIAGTQRPVFDNTKKLHHIEGEWFTSMRDFLRSIDGQIKQTTGWLPQLERVNDLCLMDVLTTPSKTDMIRINRCRIFLQATTLSDITNADGTRITDYAWTPLQNNAITNPRRSKHDWPRQPRPGPKAWKAWKGAVQRHLSKKGKGQNLKRPLGPWLVSPTNSRQHWEWYIDHATHRLIHNSTTAEITAYPLESHGGGARQQHDETRPEQLTEIPVTAIPTAVDINYSTRNKPNRIPRDTSATPTTHSTFTEYTTHLDPWEKCLFKDNANLDHKIITERIDTEARILIVSDGGMMHGYRELG